MGSRATGHDPGTKIEALHAHDVAFEVDRVDIESHTGWSVLVRETSREVALDDLPELLRLVDGDVPLPWRKAVHSIWVAITPAQVTGRRLAGELIDEDA